MDGTLQQELKQLEQYYEKQDTAAFFTHIDDMLQKLQQHEAHDAYSTLLLHKATLYAQLYNYGLAAHTLTQVAQQLQHYPNVHIQLDYFTLLATLQQANNQQHEAFNTLTMAEQYAQRHHDSTRLPRIYEQLSMYYGKQHEAAKSLHYAQQAYDEYKSMQHTERMYEALAQVANAYMKLGAYEQATPLLQELQQHAALQRDSTLYTTYVMLQANWLVAHGQQQEADELLRRQLKRVRTATIQLTIYEQLCPIAKAVQAKEQYVSDLRHYYELLEQTEQEERNSKVAAISHYFNDEAIQSTAWIDPLTHVYNRKFLEANIEQWTAKHPTFTVAIFDIDTFKAINDTYGHLVGDEVIQALAATAVEVLGKESIVIRYGGDEFILLWPHNERHIIEASLQQLQAAIASVTISHEGQHIPFTISIGVDVLALQTTKLDELLQRADEALYTAKRNGRNQYVIR